MMDATHSPISASAKGFFILIVVYGLTDTARRRYECQQGDSRLLFELLVTFQCSLLLNRKTMPHVRVQMTGCSDLNQPIHRTNSTNFDRFQENGERNLRDNCVPRLRVANHFQSGYCERRKKAEPTLEPTGTETGLLPPPG